MRRKPSAWVTLPLLAVMMAASVFLARSLDYLKETPFSFTRTWQTPSAVAVAPDGGLAVIENSKMLVTITDAQDRLCARIYGGSYDTDAFYYAEHIATDGQYVAVAEVRHAQSSTFVQGERILLYDMAGNREAVLYEAVYEEGNQPRQLGKIRGLRLQNGQVTFAWADGNRAGAALCENDGMTALFSITLDGDDLTYAAYEPLAQTLCFTTKKGALGTAKPGEAIEWLAYGDGKNIPWSVDVTPDGAVLVSELLGEQVLALRNGQAQVLWQGGLVYNLIANGEGAAFTDGENVLMLTDGGAVGYASRTVSLSPAFTIRLLLTWLSLICLTATVLWLVFKLTRLMRGQPFSEAKRRMLIASFSVLMTVIVVMAFLLSFAQKQMQSQTLHGLSQLCESISATSGSVIGDSLAAIDELSDYRGEDYNQVRNYMDAFCDASYRNDENLYYILYRFDDRMLWGVMDYENTTGVHYPYCPLEGSLYGNVVKTGESLRVDGEANIYGMWSYAIAPVYDSAGKMVGLVEIGTNQYGEVVAREALIRGVLIGVLVALMMAMLVFNEMTAFSDHLAQNRVLRERGERKTALGFIRPLIFLVFMADNMDAAYIPQLSEQLGRLSHWGLVATLSSALPMSVQLLAIGLSALLCGRLLDRSHPRTVLLCGFGLQTLGAALAIGAILTDQYWLLLLAKAVGGIGTGAAVVTCNALPGRANDPAEQQRLIAGLSVGVITGVVLGSSVGGYVAEYLGYPAAYIGSIVWVATAAVLTWRSLRGKERLMLETDGSEPEADRAHTLRFIRNPRVLGFLLCVMLPYMLMMYFKDYLFPLFASGLGKTESVIGSVMLLGGALAIFLGEAVPGALFARFGLWNTLRFANLLCAYGLALFALNPKFETAVITICVLGISASFGYTAQGVYYTDLIRRGNIGDGKGMGLYSLFDNLGQTSGPLILSALLFMGAAAESGVIALGAMGMLAVVSGIAKLGGKTRHDP